MAEPITDQEISDFVDFLRDTLIPDLHESGTEATAEDFAKCCDIIEQLQEEKNELERKADRARRLGTSPSR